MESLLSARRAPRFTILAMLLAGAEMAAAQGSATVYTTSTDNAIVSLSFGACGSAGSSTPAFDVGGSNLQGIVVRDDGAIVAGNQAQGGAPVLCRNGSCAAITSQNFSGGIGAVALDTVGNVYGLGSTDLWLFPRDFAAGGCTTPGCGYGAPRLIDAVSGVQKLADVRFVSTTGGALEAGDLVVLVESPAQAIRYAREDLEARIAGGPEPTPSPWITAGLGTPRGFALAASEALVTTASGAILRFSFSGASLGTFAQLPGTGDKISVGLDEANVLKVFASYHTGGSGVRRFTTAGECDGEVTAGLQSARGVANASLSSAALTPAGVGTTVQVAADELKFDNVTAGGVTELRAFSFEDPRDGAPGPLYLSCDAGSPCVDGLPADVATRVIPDSVRPLPAGGSARFFLLVGESSAVFNGTVRHRIFEEASGIDEACIPSGPGGSALARTYYAPTGSDPAIVEESVGASFTDISTGCGSNVGRGWGFSAFLTASDTQAVDAIASSKLDSLKLAVETSGMGGLSACISRSVRRTLSKNLDAAIRAHGSGDDARAIDKLEAVAATVRANPGAFADGSASCTPVPRNVSGELIARAKSAIYMLCGAPSDPVATAACSNLEQLP